MGARRSVAISRNGYDHWPNPYRNPLTLGNGLQVTCDATEQVQANHQQDRDGVTTCRGCPNPRYTQRIAPLRLVKEMFHIEEAKLLSPKPHRFAMATKCKDGVAVSHTAKPSDSAGIIAETIGIAALRRPP